MLNVSPPTTLGSFSTKVSSEGYTTDKLPLGSNSS